MLGDRFWSKVRETASGCWEWTAGQNGVGYGSYYLDGRQRLAHRLAYAEMVGPIPDGLHIDHICRNRLCVNPDHLDPVTQRVNNLRGVGVYAVNAAKSECANGHPLTGANLMLRGRDGSRRCRACNRNAVTRWRERQKQTA